MSTETDNNVGILGMEVYFPGVYVSQTDLEASYGVSAGKYTVGLGQDEMAFTGDREDINSISLTVVQSLLEKYDIDPKAVGRLEIGTESLVDKSKSTKTVLMELFAGSGNTDIEGATVVNACYGGTAALLNALSWVDSSAWDGRYAIVVAADIAVYAEGPARPTGGCGSVALLVGRDAPLKIDLRTRTTHATHVWDFYKPNLDSEYPSVNGALSQTCYLRALDDCYSRFVKKSRELRGKDASVPATDYLVFHAPYNKLVQKSFGRLLFQDMLLGVTDGGAAMAKWLAMPQEQTYEDKELETALKAASSAGYQAKVALPCVASKRVGNTYTASVYLNLACLVSTLGAQLLGKSVTLFSYGSGALASMFSIIPREATQGGDKFSLAAMQSRLDVLARLAAREKLSPADLALALEAREAAHGKAPFAPTFSTDKLLPGTYYLDHISDKHERFYKRKDLQAKLRLGGSLLAGQEDFYDDDAAVGVDLDDVAAALPVSAISAKKHVAKHSPTPATSELLGEKASSPLSLSRPALTRSKTEVWATGRPGVNVVVTGIAAALPGRENEVFPAGVNNVRRIIQGESFLSRVPDAVKDAMIDKNISFSQKNADGTVSKVPITTYDQCINVSATLGRISLAKYGISESIIGTMDRAVQVAIAAGLEALRDAQLVSGVGEGTKGWELPESMRSSTGVVYATSFPALDTAIEEVSKHFKSKSIDHLQVSQIVAGLRAKLKKAVKAKNQEEDGLNDETEAALKALESFAKESLEEDLAANKPYEFDRKFLFRVLVLGNAQLAQIVKARGPNMQTNAACAGATQAIAIAYDLIQVGRAERVVVIAGDSAASDNLLPWLGNGFRTLGAANIASDMTLAARPFHPERCGMILGSGGIGLVLESEEGAQRRYHAALANNAAGSLPRKPFKCRLLGTLVSNSAYHGAAMDRNHIAQEMERFVASMVKQLNITRAELARKCVYFSHETSTHASPTSACAANEIYGLRQVFGEELKNLLILNTKGFTGHPMGVSFEDVVAAEVLESGLVPPIANFTEIDPVLGDDLKISRGGAYPCKYAMRFAAGFGSQIALALYGAADL